MRRLKETYLHDKFEIHLPKDLSLLERLVGVGLVPGHTFKVLFYLKNGAMVIGNDSFKIAIDSIPASMIPITVL